VLVEEARTNLCLYSDDFTNAAWVKSNLTAAKTATGPDGVANSASTLTATAANATARQNITSASAARITSMFVKRRTGTGAVTLSQGDVTGSELWTDPTPSISNTGGTVGVYVDATNTMSNTGSAATDFPRFTFSLAGMQIGKLYKVQGTLTGDIAQISRVRLASVGADNELTYTAGTGVISGIARAGVAGIEILTNLDGAEAVIIATMSVYEVAETTVTVTSSWTRVATASATVTNPPLIIRMATSGDAIDVALFDHEVGAFITSPIPTVASQVTRAADNISILTSAFPWSQTIGTLVFEAMTEVGMGNGSYLLGLVDYSSSGNYFGVLRSSGGWVWRTGTGTPTIRNFDVTTGYTENAFSKYAASYEDDVGQGMSMNGFSVVEELSDPVTRAVTTFTLGRVANLGAVHYKRLAYYAVRKSNAELQVLST
jgi:hypothetical protein